MRGKKSYNIRNVEAHLPQSSTFVSSSPTLLSKNMVFQNNAYHNIIPNTSIYETQQNVVNEQLYRNEFINAKYGVSKYASNLVSGKMYKKV